MRAPERKSPGEGDRSVWVGSTLRALVVSGLVVALASVGGLQMSEPADQDGGVEAEPVLSVIPLCRDVHGADAATDGSTPRDHAPGESEDWADDLRAWAHDEHADSFAGSWDQSVAFTHGVEDITDEIHARFGSNLDVIEVDHSLAELRSVRRAAVEELREQADEHRGTEPVAGQLTDVTMLTRANRVRLTVAGLDEDRAWELTERYGASHICLVQHERQHRGDATVQDDAGLQGAG